MDDFIGFIEYYSRMFDKLDTVEKVSSIQKLSNLLTIFCRERYQYKVELNSKVSMEHSVLCFQAMNELIHSFSSYSISILHLDENWTTSKKIFKELVRVGEIYLKNKNYFLEPFRIFLEREIMTHEMI